MPLSSERVREIERAARGPNGERLAISLFDLDRIEPTVRSILLGGKLDLTAPVRIDPNRPEETAVAFLCPFAQAASICDIVRSHDRQAGDFPSRVYVLRRSWTKLPSNVLLTIVVDGKCLTNPEVFGYDGHPRNDEPPPVERVVLGRKAGRSNGDGR